MKSGAADACVSAGNTGALMAISRFVLEDAAGSRASGHRLDDADARGRTCILDLGANVDCTAVHLLQFAVMGAALFGVVEQVERPSVGLLNIGEEDIKGNEVVKQAGSCSRPAGSTSTATSKATTSTRAPPTSSSATALSATYF